MKRLGSSAQPPDLAAWHRLLCSRRTFLLGLAGGSLAALFGAPTLGEDVKPLDDPRPWLVLDAVQRHLLPSEADSPGAAEINALGYLRFVVQDPLLDVDERRFLLKGVDWLEGLVQENGGGSFLELDEPGREGILRRIAASAGGENWLSTLILYLLEALLTDPAYGGNPNGLGWRWLEHIPGYPRPTPDKIYPRLLA